MRDVNERGEAARLRSFNGTMMVMAVLLTMWGVLLFGLGIALLRWLWSLVG